MHYAESAVYFKLKLAPDPLPIDHYAQKFPVVYLNCGLTVNSFVLTWKADTGVGDKKFYRVWPKAM